MSDIVIQDLSTESIIVGYIFRNPAILTEYIELIIPEYDFSEEGLRFLYNLLIDTYLNHDKINETSINIQVSKMKDDLQKYYKSIGGYKVYVRLSAISEVVDNFKKHYEQLKTYNVLRHLHNKGFSIEKNLDKLKDKSVDQILKAYEYQLLKASSYIKGINDSIILGEDILEVYTQLKEKPDIGIQLPFPIIDTLIRGWRKSKVNVSALHSGLGKSRMMVFMLCYLSIINQIPILFLINEQDKSEVDLMILTCIANNVFGSTYGLYVDETDIALGRCTGETDKMVTEAAIYIKERSRIHFKELESWDYDSLKMILKKHKLKGVNYAIVDTFKAMRGIGNSDMPDWMQFVYTAEQLKKLIGSEAKGGLNMGLWLTMQMTDDSLITKMMNSSSIASAKQTKHHFDYLQMSRRLDPNDKEKIKVLIEIPNNPFNGQTQKLDINKNYYMTYIDKNRSGIDKKYLIYEVDNGKMIWKELGYASFSKN